MQLKTLHKANLKNQKVLVRADLNLPIKDGKVTDATRLQEIKSTIEFLHNSGSKIAICSHLGRPDGKINTKYSLFQIVKNVQEVLNLEVVFIDDCLHPELSEKLEKLKSNQIILLENTRFYPEEETNEKTFASKLASPFDLYINDAFGTAHRAHASTEGVTHFLDSYAGLLMQKEIEALSPLLNENNVEKPLTLVVGGAKIDTKIGIIKNFIGVADYILIGGALGSTFLFAEGFNTGKSLVEKDKKDTAQEILLLAETTKTKILIPGDVVLADNISPDAETIDLPVEDITSEMMILDIGRLTARKFSSIIHKSKTVILNGPMGLYEMKPFANGTAHIIEEIAKSQTFSILGGGDTIDALNLFKIPHSKFTHISTGGGAMIEFLEGKTLPGITPLME